MNDETFTIRLDADDQPVQRRLEEMTADEVLAALAWHREDADKAEIEYEEAHSDLTCVMQGLGPPDVAEMEAAAPVVIRTAIQIGRYHRLRRRVHRVLRRKLGWPDNREAYDVMPPEELVRLHWAGVTDCRWCGSQVRWCATACAACGRPDFWHAADVSAAAHNL